jgi:hypothetical protein
MSAQSGIGFHTSARAAQGCDSPDEHGMQVVALSLVAQTVPFAAVIAMDEDNKWGDLFVLAYFCLIGLIVSLIAIVDDYYSYSTLIGVTAEGLEY